jgi:hypothetical protein
MRPLDALKLSDRNVFTTQKQLYRIDVVPGQIP